MGVTNTQIKNAKPKDKPESNALYTYNKAQLMPTRTKMMMECAGFFE
ncbi:MAG: hypothetical protein ACI9GE_000759 [Oceanospirillaceae bacterium]|jgi:hypothetical protein